MKLTIFGASGDTGEHLVRLAVDHGHDVIAVEREFPAKWESHDRIHEYEADVLTDDLTDAVSGSDVILSTLGISKSPMVMLDPPALYTESALKISRAMKAAKVDRMICISAAFADPKVKVPLWFKGTTMVAMNRIFTQIADMERVFAAAGLTTTFVRPGWLLDLPFSDDYQVSENGLPPNVLRSRRADVAHFMLKCAEEGQYKNEKPFIGRPEAFIHENPAALIPEIAASLGLPT